MILCMSSDKDSCKSPGELTRRELIAGSLTLPLAARAAKAEQAAPAAKGPRPKVVVVGAGAFGGWSAYALLRRGARVTLLDAWGPGNSRSSSGGETRVMRTLYGDYELYTDLALDALALWKEHEKRFRRPLFRRTGMLIFGADPLVLEALPLAAERNIVLREVDPKVAAERYPQASFEGIHRVFEDDDTGFLYARQACRAVVEHFVAEGGDYRQADVRPGPIQDGRLGHVLLSDGTRLEADIFLFACGSWMPRIFPDVLGSRITPSRQEVHYFGTPAGDPRYAEDTFPVWTDRTSGGFYGIPGNRDRGFKVAFHQLGPRFDPTTDDRLPRASEVAQAREFIARRFPPLAGAPLVEGRVCHYANSPDSSFVVDRHPGAHNLWLVGGGTGHGFKHGPALGERVAGWALGDGETEPLFSLARFKST